VKLIYTTKEIQDRFESVRTWGDVRHKQNVMFKRRRKERDARIARRRNRK
jgi:hypothetical protein